MKDWLEENAGKMLRKVSPIVRPGKFGFLLSDLGGLVRAWPTSSDRWAFSEKGITGNPLVVFGYPEQLDAFFKRNVNSGIVSHIRDQEDIYISISGMSISDRFRKISPLRDGMVKAFNDTIVPIARGPFMNSLTDPLPKDVAHVPAWQFHNFTRIFGNVGDALSTFRGAARSIEAPGIKHDWQQKSVRDMVMVTFHFMPGSGMRQISTGELAFRELETACTGGFSLRLKHPTRPETLRWFADGGPVAPEPTHRPAGGTSHRWFE